MEFQMLKRLSLLFLITIHAQSNASEYVTSLLNYCTPKAVAVGIGALAAVIGLKWLRTPDKSLATIEQLRPKTICITNELEVHTEIVDKIKKPSNDLNGKTRYIKKTEDSTVYKLSPSISENNQNICIAVGSSLHNLKCCEPSDEYFGYLLLKSNIINIPCVTFDNITDTRRGYSFGGAQDIFNLQLVFNEVKRKNPKAHITLIGNCKGATVILRFLASKAEKNEINDLNSIQSVILESPPISLHHTIKDLPLSCVPHAFYKIIFPNYNHSVQTILNAKKFPVHIPLLFGCSYHDNTTRYKYIQQTIQHLKQIGCKNIYVYASNNKLVQHANLGKDEKFQQSCQLFQKKFACLKPLTEKEEKKLTEMHL